MITTKDIRNAYIQIHCLKLDSLKEFERFGLLTADGHSAEDLSLPIEEFMVKVGFACKVMVEYTASEYVKRPYNKRVK